MPTFEFECLKMVRKMLKMVFFGFFFRQDGFWESAVKIIGFWSTSNSLETQNTILFFCHLLRTGAVTKLASQRHSHNVGT